MYDPHRELLKLKEVLAFVRLELVQFRPGHVLTENDLAPIIEAIENALPEEHLGDGRTVWLRPLTESRGEPQSMMVRAFMAGG